jgi:hypothetical protein
LIEKRSSKTHDEDDLYEVAHEYDLHKFHGRVKSANDSSFKVPNRLRIVDMVSTVMCIKATKFDRGTATKEFTLPSLDLGCLMSLLLSLLDVYPTRCSGNIYKNFTIYKTHKI